MSEDLMSFELPQETSSIIKVIGVGGGGSNAVNHMFKQGIKDVNFIVCNTDSQALEASPVSLKVQLGSSLTEGRGAGNKPDRGRQAAIENLDDVLKAVSDNTKMVFITAGMGGGTGTGAAPIIAKATKDIGILTVGIVTIPFRFEGQRRISQAVEGITELSQHVDSLLVINNEKLREIYGDLKLSHAFAHADDILTIAAKGIAEIITVHGHLNVDFADVQTVMTDSGVALMGSATASGEGRALKAIQDALNSPLLNNNDIRGAKNVLLNISSGSEEATMDEIGEINDYVQEAAGHTADLIWGNTVEESLGDKISVTVIATGFQTDIIPELFSENKKKKNKEVHSLNETAKTSSIKKQESVFEVSNKSSSYTSSSYASENGSDKKSSGMKKEEVFELFDDDDDSSDFVNENTEELSDNEILETAKNALERVSDLQENNPASKSEYNKNNVNYTDNIEKFENEPAFKRKKRFSLEDHLDTSSDNEQEVSNYTLSDEDDKPRLKKNNSYLHERVD